MKKCTKIFCSVLMFLFALGLVCSAEEKFSFSREVPYDFISFNESGNEQDDSGVYE